MVNTNPLAKPIVGSEVISGQITDKALALFDLLNQVTGTEGGTFKTFDIDGESLSLGLYRTEKDADSPAWQQGEIIYFQDSASRLEEIESKLRENFTKLQNDITGNISKLYDLIGKSSTGEISTDDASILGMINKLANDDSSSVEDLESNITNLLTDKNAIEALVDKLFEQFELDVQRLNEEIFDLLDDNDDIFSNSGDSETDTTSSSPRYLLSLGDKEAKLTIDNHPEGKSHLEQAFDITLEFLKERYENNPANTRPWNEASEIALRTSDMFTRGNLLLDPELIDAIIEAKFSSDPVTRADELTKVTSQGQFLAKFSTLREFMDFSKDVYQKTNDNDTFKELFTHDLAARTPKYYEDQRSLMDVLRGKSGDGDSSSTSPIFQSAGQKIESAAEGALQALGSGFDKLSTNNFESFVRNNPVVLIEYLLEAKATSSDDEAIALLNDQIAVLQEFHDRQLTNFTSWIKEKNKRLAKAKLIIESLEAEKANPKTSIERQAEIDEKIALLISSTMENNASLEPEPLRSKAEFAINKLEAIKANTSDSSKIESIDKDIELIQASLATDDSSIAELAIRNGMASVINRVLATDIADILNLTKSLGENSPEENQAILDKIKLAYDNHDFLEMADISEIEVSQEALDAAIDTILRTQNTHSALYASETLEAGKINSRYTGRKLSTPDADGNLPEDNQLAPPQISPTPMSAAIAVIGQEILFKAQNLLRETDIPDETWVTDNAKVLTAINERITPDLSNLDSAGAVFLDQLKTAFKDIIIKYVNDTKDSSQDINDAKLTYNYEKNLAQNNNINGSNQEILSQLSNAFDWLDTGNLGDAANKIFLQGYKDPDNYFADKGLAQIEEKLVAIMNANQQNNPLDLIKGLRDQIKELDPNENQSAINNLNAQIRTIETKRQEYNLASNLLNGTGSQLGIKDIKDHLDDKKASILDKASSAEISGKDAQETLKRYTKKLYKDFSNDVLNNEELEKIQDELNDTLKTTDFDLDGNETNDFIDIENVINGIDGLADNISNVFGDKEGKGQILAQLENSLIAKQYLQAELAQSLTSELNSPDTSTERQVEISKILYGYEEITNSDGSISFDIGTIDDPKANSLISDIEDLSDIDENINIDKTTILRQVLAPEFINAPASPEKTAAISKVLFGFTTEKLENGTTVEVIGSPNDLKNKSLLANIEELKTKATRILDKALPEDETDLINLMDEVKADYTSIEQQSIKRLILLMFVLSMLEYSDWDYRKQEADPSRYAVS